MNKLRCYSQESFRRELIKRDQHCILSGLSAEVSEAAHIVNKEYLETDNKELRFTKQNGILLNSCLHKEFDLHFWTVDINHDLWLQQKDNKDILELTCTIKLYPPAIKKKLNHLKLSIFNYDTITIPMGCVPFFNMRNQIVKRKFYNPNCYTEEFISSHIKSDFLSNSSKPSTIERSISNDNTSSKKRIRQKSKSTKKKRSRYTKTVVTSIREWITRCKENKKDPPTLEERKTFSENIGIDHKVFESRFVKYWRK